MGIDLDNNQNTDAIRAKLATDLHVAAFWVSPEAGSGLKVIVNITAPTRACIHALSRPRASVFKNIASIVDQSGKDPAHLASSRTTKPSLCAMATCKFWSH